MPIAIEGKFCNDPKVAMLGGTSRVAGGGLTLENNVGIAVERQMEFATTGVGAYFWVMLVAVTEMGMLLEIGRGISSLDFGGL